MKLLTIATVGAILSLCGLESVDAHSWLVKPVSRGRGPDVDNSQACMGSTTRGQATSYMSGETIDVAYWRNNHLGGFIRWSIVPAGQETSTNFDQNAFFYTCRESGVTCLPNGRNERFSGDGSGDNTISCGDTITLPDWLPVGDYTMQWMWFGVGLSYGNIGYAEGQFKSCADIRLTTAGIKAKAPVCPTFVGGDRVTKLENRTDDQCFYFHSTKITKVQYKGDNDKALAEYKFGVPADVERCKEDEAAASDSDNDEEDAHHNSTATPLPTSKPPSSSLAPSPTTEKPTLTTKCSVKSSLP